MTPIKTFGIRFEWTRNENGSVTVTNHRRKTRLTFPNMGEALRAAQAAKGRTTNFRYIF